MMIKLLKFRLVSNSPNPLWVIAFKHSFITQRNPYLTVTHSCVYFYRGIYAYGIFIAFQDLEDMGIVRLGHQKKILLAIKRVKDIRAGKRSISTQGSLDFTRLQPGQVCTIVKHVDFYCVYSDVLGLVY